MTQTSSQPLSPQKEHRLFEQLITLLADIDHPSKMRQFLATFLTDTEQTVLAKRLGVLWMLSQGMSYEEIKNELHVSSATISSVSELVKTNGASIAFAFLQHDLKITSMLKKWFT